MRDFFKPWRRKAGCVTLVLACAFAAGWVRSLFICDVLFVHRYVFGSNNGLLTWVLCQDQGESYSYRAKKLEPVFLTLIDVEWSSGWDKFRIGAGRNGNPTGNRVKFAIAPYWSVVLSLTVLSAYLLLAKPQVAIPKDAVEPTTVERA